MINDLIDFDYGLDSNELDNMNFNHFESIEKKPYFPTPDEMIKITKKGELYIGAEFDEMYNFIGHATIPTKEFTMHQFIFAVSGAGKTEMLKFQYTCILIQKDMARTLKDEGKLTEDEVKIFDILILDNLGNFNKFGEPILQSKSQFLKFYLASGWHPDYLRSLGKKWVKKYKPNNESNVGLWHNSVIVPNLKSTLSFLNYLTLLGINLSGIQGQIYQTLDRLEVLDNRILSKKFDFKLFYLEIKSMRDEMIHEAKWFCESPQEQRKMWNDIANLDQVIAPLETLDREYKNTFDKPTFEDGKITIQDCSTTSDRWLFHSAIFTYMYFKFAKKPENLQSIKLMVSTDEYNDMLDDASNDSIPDYEQKREAKLANWTRSQFLRLIREGRNYGTPIVGATQNPSQLLIKEGRKFASINSKWIGYLGTEIDKMEENKKGGGTFGSQKEVVYQESQSRGWISQKYTGKWLLISETGARRIQTFISCYN